MSYWVTRYEILRLALFIFVSVSFIGIFAFYFVSLFNYLDDGKMKKEIVEFRQEKMPIIVVILVILTVITFFLPTAKEYSQIKSKTENTWIEKK